MSEAAPTAAGAEQHPEASSNSAQQQQPPSQGSVAATPAMLPRPAHQLRMLSLSFIHFRFIHSHSFGDGVADAGALLWLAPKQTNERNGRGRERRNPTTVDQPTELWQEQRVGCK